MSKQITPQEMISFLQANIPVEGGPDDAILTAIIERLKSTGKKPISEAEQVGRDEFKSFVGGLIDRYLEVEDMNIELHEAANCKVWKKSAQDRREAIEAFSKEFYEEFA